MRILEYQQHLDVFGILIESLGISSINQVYESKILDYRLKSWNINNWESWNMFIILCLRQDFIGKPQFKSLINAIKPCSTCKWSLQQTSKQRQIGPFLVTLFNVWTYTDPLTLQVHCLKIINFKISMFLSFGCWENTLHIKQHCESLFFQSCVRYVIKIQFFWNEQVLYYIGPLL